MNQGVLIYNARLLDESIDSPGAILIVNKKILSKILIASMFAGGINFAPAVVNFDVKNLKIISVQHQF